MDIDNNNVFGVIQSDQVNDLANHFLEEYYGKVGNVGWNAIQHVYTPESIISCNTRVYTGGHQFLNALSGEYIRRANYGQMNATWSQIDESKMMITVFGEIQLVSFTGECSGVGHFSESFVIRAYPGQMYAVTHQHFYFS